MVKLVIVLLSILRRGALKVLGMKLSQCLLFSNGLEKKFVCVYPDIKE